MKKALLISIQDERPVQAEEVEVQDNYRGDCYGDSVGFSVGSNQYIRTLGEGETLETWLSEHVFGRVTKLDPKDFDRNGVYPEGIAEEGSPFIVWKCDLTDWHYYDFGTEAGDKRYYILIDRSEYYAPHACDIVAFAKKNFFL